MKRLQHKSQRKMVNERAFRTAKTGKKPEKGMDFYLCQKMM